MSTQAIPAASSGAATIHHHHHHHRPPPLSLLLLLPRHLPCRLHLTLATRNRTVGRSIAA
jgi:hypothetical protein